MDPVFRDMTVSLNKHFLSIEMRSPGYGNQSARALYLDADINNLKLGYAVRRLLLPLNDGADTGPRIGGLWIETPYTSDEIPFEPFMALALTCETFSEVTCCWISLIGNVIVIRPSHRGCVGDRAAIIVLEEESMMVMVDDSDEDIGMVVREALERSSTFT